MKISIFGATGSVGKCLVRQALEKGYQVKGFGRNPSKLEIENMKFEFVRGDVLSDIPKIEDAISGSDAVLITLGAGTKGHVRGEGTRNIINIMQMLNVNRLICQSTLGAGDSAENLNFKWRMIFKFLLNKVMQDHELQEKYVRESALDWTIIRPSAFTDGPSTKDYQFGFSPKHTKMKFTISRSDVADFMLRQIEDKTYFGKAVSVSN